MEITNKTFAIIGIIVLAFLQLVAYSLGFDGQFTILVTGVITYLFGVVTGQETKREVIVAQKETISALANKLLDAEKPK